MLIPTVGECDFMIYKEREISWLSPHDAERIDSKTYEHVIQSICALLKGLGRVPEVVEYLPDEPRPPGSGG